MDEFDKALRYIFILSFILILVAYWAGSTKLLSGIGTVSAGLLNTVTGRDSNGKFSAYPTGG